LTGHPFYPHPLQQMKTVDFFPLVDSPYRTYLMISPLSAVTSMLPLLGFSDGPSFPIVGATSSQLPSFPFYLSFSQPPLVSFTRIAHIQKRLSSCDHLMDFPPVRSCEKAITRLFSPFLLNLKVSLPSGPYIPLPFFFIQSLVPHPSYQIY